MSGCIHSACGNWLYWLRVGWSGDSQKQGLAYPYCCLIRGASVEDCKGSKGQWIQVSFTPLCCIQCTSHSKPRRNVFPYPQQIHWRPNEATYWICTISIGVWNLNIQNLPGLPSKGVKIQRNTWSWRHLWLLTPSQSHPLPTPHPGGLKWSGLLPLVITGADPLLDRVRIGLAISRFLSNFVTSMLIFAVPPSHIWFCSLHF